MLHVACYLFVQSILPSLRRSFSTSAMCTAKRLPLTTKVRLPYPLEKGAHSHAHMRTHAHSHTHSHTRTHTHARTHVHAHAQRLSPT